MKKRLQRLFRKSREAFRKYSGWEIVVFVLGTLSFITILVTLFLPIGYGPANITTTSDVPEVSSEEFVNTVSSMLTLPTEQGSDIEIINNGDQFLTSFLSEIDAARSSINVMTYIWKDGSMSDQIIEHLTKKAREGIEVRVMLDAFGGMSAPKKKFNVLKDAGGKVATFNSFTFGKLTRYHKRNHRRSIVIDGAMAYTGGIGFKDNWLGDARNPDEWRDMMFKVEGTMARSIQGAFADLWAGTTGEVLIGEKFYPAVKEKDTLAYVPLASSPLPDNLMLQKFILLSLLASQEKIYMTTPYFLPDVSMRDALIEKAHEGVDVRILVANKYNDAKSVRAASQYEYEKLLKEGVKIYEYQPTFIHTKAIVVDTLWSIIGSANMDNRSRVLNEENIYGIQSADFGKSMEEIFTTDLENAKEITLAEWQKRGIVARAHELFARKFVQQF